MYVFVLMKPREDEPVSTSKLVGVSIIFFFAVSWTRAL